MEHQKSRQNSTTTLKQRTSLRARHVPQHAPDQPQPWPIYGQPKANLVGTSPERREVRKEIH